MILPNNNISIMDVRNILSVPSMDLGTLCSKAKIGGIGGYAYKIKENGYSANDGKLIDGAEPYHNLYSTNNCAEWVLPELNYNSVYNRLLRDSNDNYKFSLGSFRKYNSNARGVGHVYYNTQATQYEGTQNKKTITFMPTISLGDYDWRIKNAKGNIQAAKVAVVIDCTSIGGTIFTSPKVTLSGQTSITFDLMSFEIDTRTVRSYQLPSKIALYSSVNDLVGYLPGEGVVNIEITSGQKVGELYVEINSLRNIYTLVGELRKGVGTLYGTFRYNAVFDEKPETERTLKKIEYQVINRNTEQVVRTVTVTSGFRDDEMPKNLYREQTQFSVVTDRVAPIATEYVRAIMYY